MIKEILYNKETYDEKYIGLNCTIPKNAKIFSYFSPNANGELGGMVGNNSMQQGRRATHDISGKITGSFLATEENDETSRIHFFIAYVDNSNLVPDTFIMIARKSDVEIENGGVLNSLLIHVYQLFTRIFRKELIA